MKQNNLMTVRRNLGIMAHVHMRVPRAHLGVNVFGENRLDRGIFFRCEHHVASRKIAVMSAQRSALSAQCSV